MSEWINVNDKLPRCSRDENALGVEVLIWPRVNGEATAFYGRRATGRPDFYKYGATMPPRIKFWMALPKGPKP